MTPAMCRLIVTCLALCASATAPAQPKPVQEGKGGAAGVQQVWAKAVEKFAGALVKGDLGAVGALLAPRASVRPFDAVADEEVWRVFERVSNGALVGHHSYIHPPLLMASDIASDFKAAKAVPDAGKTRFLVDDDSEMKRANATAVQWLEQQLDARHGALVGIVVLWVQRAGSAGEGSAGQEPVFVLLKGEEVSPGSVKVRTVLYGMPISADGRH